MKIFLLQHNPIPGDFMGNARQLADLARRAASDLPKSEHILCLSPAYALAGVPWKRLKHIGGFYSRCRDAARELVSMLAEGPDLLISLTGAELPLYVLISKGELIPLSQRGRHFLQVGKDGPCFYLPESDPAWAHQEAQNNLDPVSAQKADAILFDSSCHFVPDVQERREMHLCALAGLWNLPVFSVQQCGATDSLVFPGQSCVINASGKAVSRAAAFSTDIIGVELDQKKVSSLGENPAPILEGDEAIWGAATLGIRDYIRKTGLKGALIGLSGGMDSALVLCLAAEAVGPENVLAVAMPSRWNSDDSLKDAKQLAENLGIRLAEVSIEPMMAAFSSSLEESFSALPPTRGDLTADNIQPRIRGTILMAFANRTSYAVLAPGNKSEIAMGYSTLYGDTVGALEPIGDLFKTEVYRLARWYNTSKGREIIPENIFTKAPSAELHANQADTDSLPPYPILDPMIHEIMDNGATPDGLIISGSNDAMVQDVFRRFGIAEFKRHQCPPIIKLSPCTFGIDWELPASAKILR